MSDLLTTRRSPSWIRWAVLGVLTVIAAVVFTLLTPRFLSVGNLTNIAGDIAVVGLLALPAVFLLMAGHVDLSAGAASALSGVITATAAADLGLPTAVVIGVLTGAAVGLLNGLLVAYARINSIAATFATMAVLRALATLIPSGMAITLTGFRSLGHAELLPGLTTPILLFVVLAVLAVPAARTTIGRRSRDVATVEQPRPGDRRWVLLLFVASGVIAAVVGLIRTSQLGTGLPSASLGVEISVVTAVLLGGGRLSGGTGSVPGTVLVLLFMAVIDNGLSMSNVTPYVGQLFHATMLVIALLVSGAARDRLRPVPSGEPEQVSEPGRSAAPSVSSDRAAVQPVQRVSDRD